MKQPINVKGMILEILKSKFNYFRPNEDLLIAIIDFEMEYSNIIDLLSEFEVKVLAMFSYQYDTFTEVAKELGFSHEYIRLTYFRAIEKIFNAICE